MPNPRLCFVAYYQRSLPNSLDVSFRLLKIRVPFHPLSYMPRFDLRCLKNHTPTPFEKLYSHNSTSTRLTPQSNPPQAMYQRRGPCWGREAHVLGAQETCLGAGRVAKHFHFGVLQGAGDGAVHEAPNPKLRHSEFAFQHGVLYDGETGRPGEGARRGQTGHSVRALEEVWRQVGPRPGSVKRLEPKRNSHIRTVPWDLNTGKQVGDTSELFFCHYLCVFSIGTWRVGRGKA